MQIPSIISFTAHLAARRLASTWDRAAAPGGGLSTNRRPGRTWRDAAGSALARRLQADAAALRQGSRNAQHAISALQGVAGALTRIRSLLEEMRELAEEAGSGTYSQAQLEAMQAEFEGMIDEVSDVANSVEVGGVKPLASAGGGIVVSLGHGSSNPAKTIQLGVVDVTGEELGLTGELFEPTIGTLTADASEGIDDPSGVYMRGPTKSFAELTFTFHGSQGDKAIALQISGNESLNDIVASINSESAALVEGWTAAEASQVSETWVLKVSTYEAGEYAAPTVEVDGELTWKEKSPVGPSDFTGESGLAGSAGPLQLTAADAVTEIDDAIATVEELQGNLDSTMKRLASAISSNESAAKHLSATESRIIAAGEAPEEARSTKLQVLGEGGLALLLQANVETQAVLNLLDIPSLAGRTGSAWSGPVGRVSGGAPTSAGLSNILFTYFGLAPAQSTFLGGGRGVLV